MKIRIGLATSNDLDHMIQVVASQDKKLLQGDTEMRISNYRFAAPIKDGNYWSQKKRRVYKIREEEFGKELEDALYKNKPEAKKKKDVPLIEIV